jgi:hypothetical protein
MVQTGTVGPLPVRVGPTNFTNVRRSLQTGGSNTCQYAYDRECDDGSTGEQQYCAAGTDDADCSNTCRFAYDRECDDGSTGNQQYCAAGTDDDDCSNTCQHAYDGECDDGSMGGQQYCATGTDTSDCDGRTQWEPRCAETVAVPPGVREIRNGDLYCGTVCNSETNECNVMVSATIPESVSSVGPYGFAGETKVCVDSHHAVSPNLPWVPSCHMACEEGTTLPVFEELNFASTTAPTCTLCPFPERCLTTGCAEGSWSVGCNKCSPGWYALGSGCTKCPEGNAIKVQIGVGVAVGTTIIGGVWKLSHTPDLLADLENAKGKVDKAASLASQGASGDGRPPAGAASAP